MLIYSVVIVDIHLLFLFTCFHSDFLSESAVFLCCHAEIYWIFIPLSQMRFPGLTCVSSFFIPLHTTRYTFSFFLCPVLLFSFHLFLLSYDICFCLNFAPFLVMCFLFLLHENFFLSCIDVFMTAPAATTGDALSLL